jgi:hypothetical protein
MFDRKGIIEQGHHWFGEKPLSENNFGFLYTIVNLKTIYWQKAL